MIQMMLRNVFFTVILNIVTFSAMASDQSYPLSSNEAGTEKEELDGLVKVLAAGMLNVIKTRADGITTSEDHKPLNLALVGINFTSTALMTDNATRLTRAYRHRYGAMVRFNSCDATAPAAASAETDFDRLKYLATANLISKNSKTLDEQIEKFQDNNMKYDDSTAASFRDEAKTSLRNLKRKLDEMEASGAL